MWNNQGKEQSQTWSTHDLACAHCRARKIRCGRERPQCESCKRDGVECRYSSPGKRINHVKLLCQNFEALEDQLNNIQGELSALTSLVRSGSASRPPTDHGEEWTLEEYHDGGCASSQNASSHGDRHIVRDETHSVDRYHGPCSLFTLCKQFHDEPVFQSSSNEPAAENETVIRALLQQMCAEASKEDHMDIASEYIPIALPPRQFLNMVTPQFFRNADYTTDIFVHSNFQAQMDRVYSQAALSPVDEAWAVCFNVVLLLALGKDKATAGSDPFLQPFVQTMRMAINNPRIFFAPRLVNVQALALLSHAAERYSPPGFCEIVFAQACLLAKTMGLHQSRATSDGHTPEEAVERHKVFRSLYIRDKDFAICRGSPSSLPSYDSNISRLSDQQLHGDEARHTPRIQLARIQDEVYRCFHSAEAPMLPPSRRSHLLSRLEQKLDRWASAHQITKMPISSPDTINIMLSFFATRICAFRGSREQRLSHQAFKDAKACCILLLSATAPHQDVGFIGTFDQLLDRKRSSSPVDLHASQSRDTLRPQGDDGDGVVWALPKLSASFPLAAFFLVAKSIVQQIAADDDVPSNAEEEMALLETLRDRYMNAVDHDRTQSFMRKISRTLDLLVRVTRQKSFPETANTPSMIFNDLSSTSSQRGGSRKDTPPELDPPSATDSFPDGLSSTSSLLFPFMQPFGGGSGGPPPAMSPPTSNSPQRQGNGGIGVVHWPTGGGSYRQQVDPSAGRMIKRPRLSGQAEQLFDMTTAFVDHGHHHHHHHHHHQQQHGDDPLSMFDLLAGSNEISVFEAELK